MADVPDVIVERLHHAGFSLTDGCLQAFRLTVAGHSRRGMTYCTIGIHLQFLCRARLVVVSPDMIHDLASGIYKWAVKTQESAAKSNAELR